MPAVPKAKLKELLTMLGKEYSVLVPAKTNDSSGFVPFKENIEPDLGANVLISPKGLFLPQTEKMYKFKTRKSELEIEYNQENNQPRLLFGVRSCDVQSLNCLDQVFLKEGLTDAFYKRKRNNTVIFALSCCQPSPACFCRAMGIDPQKAPGADVQTYLDGDYIGFEAISDKGQKAVQSLKSLLTEQEVTLPPFGEYQLKVDVEGAPGKLKEMFDSPVWDEVSRKCLNCGACAYICPTCHCFDISQEVRGENVTKFRCWDTCMVEEYTQMAGGYNPRPSKKERVRNRFMHKLNYFPERYGMLLCTGCGRCITVCPVYLDITSVIRTVKEAD